MLFAQADSQLQIEKRSFHQTALDYVVKLQEVNEKKKFEFVETVSWFLSWQSISVKLVSNVWNKLKFANKPVL